ncbi:hypothetical protein B0J18DRAFT_148962 [Chaetomium sp. MPI-SDFR-AT-0129]|nr:hypothetical protein B0J18DRAFT_148962 [Chaetomium sp. MPI-SDFR-AT-0129]
MKYTTAVLALAAAAVSAQDISIFPECSLPCIIDGIGTTSCATTDFVCVCKNMDAIKQAATPCVVEKCGIDVGLNQVLPATEKFCAAVGDGSSSSSAPPAESTTESTAPTSASSSSEEAQPSETETPGGGDDEPATTTTETGSFITPSPTGSLIPSFPSGGDEYSTPTETATSSVYTAGAAVVGAVGGFGMMLMGAVAAL